MSCGHSFLQSHQGSIDCRGLSRSNVFDQTSPNDAIWSMNARKPHRESPSRESRITLFLYHRAMPRDPTLFETAIDVPLWLEADKLTPYSERARRDREIGRQVSESGA